MYAVLNYLDTTAVRNILRTVLLAIGFVLVFAAINFVVPVVIAAIAAAVTAVATVVVAVGTVVTHAAIYAVTLLLWCLVRAAVVVALAKALPALWRLLVALYRNRDGVLVAAKGLALAGIVVGVFLVALVWAPVIVAGCCTVLPQAGIVAGVFGGVIGLMKVG